MRFACGGHCRRFLFFVISDILIFTASIYLSFLVRFDFNLDASHYHTLTRILPYFLVVKLGVFLLYRIYSMSWRYASLHDMAKIFKAVVVSQALLVYIVLFSRHFLPLPFISPGLTGGFSRGVLVMDGALTFIFVTGLRASKRLFLEVFKKTGDNGKKTVIIGAGNAGEMLVRDLLRNRGSGYSPAALLDDDELKQGNSIQGVRVLGGTESLESVVRRVKAEAVIIAITSIDYSDLRRIYESAKKCGIEDIKVVPNIYGNDGSFEISVQKLEDISIEDLIGRQNVHIDCREIEEFIHGKSVLVTGAGGSIGAEIVMQVAASGPGRIILLDIDETELHNMELKMKKLLPHLFTVLGREGPESSCRVSFVVADIRDESKIDRVFESCKPDILFHAAAYKHVPMMEYNPEEAVKVNILGTYNLARAALKHRLERFIMISTDKAVRPTSVMGASKNVAERICSAFNACAGGATSFVSVRFGNVLGSRGSVLPFFLSQLKSGGPLTVTDREMKRYFMTIPEAVSLVLQAAVIGKGGDVLVLDMGEPVRIVKLAEELIKIHGLRPYKDIGIEFTGIRPGENLFEDMHTADEIPTRHEKVFISKRESDLNMEELDALLGSFRELLNGGGLHSQKSSAIKELLTRSVVF